jgi:hypothetical protein
MKYHNETLCIDILNKQKCLFFKNGGQESKTALSGGLYQWARGGNKEKM